MWGHSCLEYINTHKLSYGLDLKSIEGLFNLFFFSNMDKNKYWSGSAYYLFGGAYPIPNQAIQPYADSKVTYCQFNYALFLCHDVMKHSFGTFPARQRCLWDF